MEVFEVGVEKDHIERLAKAKPLNAISELIWNAYDASASKVEVEFQEGLLVKLELIRVKDNGKGIPFELAQETFASLGGSWKQKQRRTDEGRAIHGIKGQGRMKAFALGETVVWQSDCEGKHFSINGSLSNLKKFEISGSTKAMRRGCVVEITDITRDWEVRGEHGFSDQIRDVFALQLYEDTSFEIIYDGEKIDAAEAIRQVTSFPLSITLEDGTQHQATLEVVEWRKPVTRKLLLCLPGRFSFHEMQPGIRARGFNFTAYLTADHFQVLVDEDREALIELDLLSQAMIAEAKEAMRVHFRERETHRSRAKIDEWQKEGVYPYSGHAENPIGPVAL